MEKKLMPQTGTKTISRMGQVPREDALAAIQKAKVESLKKEKNEKVSALEKEASTQQVKLVIAVAILAIGFLIYVCCDKYTEGIFGIQHITWTYMFSWVIMFIGAVRSFIQFSRWSSKKSEADTFRNMSISEYQRIRKH